MTTYNVSDASQLQSALSSATGGDKIVLAAGNYGSLTISNRNFATNVTIQSAAPNGAHLDGLFIQNSKNLSFSGLDLGRSLVAGEAEWAQLNWIRNSSNVKFDNVTFHGSADNNPTNDGVGLQLTGVTGFSMTNSTFTELYRGIAVRQSANLTVQANDFHVIRSDGMVVAAVDGISIDGNNFSDFRPIIPDHSDAIQFWNIGETRGSTNITIKNNVLMQGQFSGVEGTGTQGIWISDPLEYGYQNVLIQNNLVYSNGAYNGISVKGGTDVQILDNTILSQGTDSKEFWIRLEGGSNINLQGNLADNIILKDVVNLYQNDNVNLAVTPGDRASILHLNDAVHAADLIHRDNGYQLPIFAPAAPVSGAVGSGLSNLLSQAAGTSLSKALASDMSHTLDMSGSKAALVTAVPLPSAAPAVAEAFASPAFAAADSTQAHPGGGNWLQYIEHFTAMA